MTPQETDVVDAANGYSIRPARKFSAAMSLAEAVRDEGLPLMMPEFNQNKYAMGVMLMKRT